jgi:ABC-type transporter Mla MlaB component
VAERIKRIVYPFEKLRHADVMTIGKDIQRSAGGKVVVLDLRHTKEATTAALAGLILLRQRQIKAGGDILLVGLDGKAQYLYEILRLAKILPRRPCITPRRVQQKTQGRASEFADVDKVTV